jgi:hypothetical protein
MDPAALDVDLVSPSMVAWRWCRVLAIAEAVWVLRITLDVVDLCSLWCAVVAGVDVQPLRLDHTSRWRAVIRNELGAGRKPLPCC